MKKHLHIGYYLSIIIMLFLGSLLVFAYRSDLQTQMIVVVMIGFFYVVLGLIHHRMQHDMHIKIVIEYILIATLGISVVFFLLKQGFGL